MKNKLREWWLRLQRLLDLTEYIDVCEAAENIRENVAFRGPNIVILFCAIVIASVGLNVNSIPVIIGAMLISPLMSPIVGFGMALGTNDVDLLKESLKNLGIMVTISILSAALFFFVSPLELEHPSELLARTNPTIYDVLIALFGGFAGIVELSRKDKGTVVVGVAIATALMPPLCTVGFGLATLQAEFFFGALYLFFINFTFIALAAFIGTRYLGYERKQDANLTARRRTKWVMTLVLVAIIVPSILSAITVVQQNAFEQSANRFVSAYKNYGRSYIYDFQVHHETKPATVELYIAGEVLDSLDTRALYQYAEEYGLLSSQLILRQDAAYEGVRALDETELVKDLFKSNEEKLQARNQQIAVLQQECDSLRHLYSNHVAAVTLPAEQIAAEIRTLYPEVADVLLARTNDGQIVCILHTEKKLASIPMEEFRSWLMVRLQVSSVIVVRQ